MDLAFGSKIILVHVCVSISVVSNHETGTSGFCDSCFTFEPTPPLGVHFELVALEDIVIAYCAVEEFKLRSIVAALTAIQ